MSDPLRFFVPAATLQGEQVVLEGEPYHHLRNVLRVKPGARILLMDGLGCCCEVQIDEMQPKQATTSTLRRWQETPDDLTITLMQSLPKGDKFELILQKGTELGISVFKPLATKHSVPNLSPDRLKKREQRWAKITSEAARQSRRSILPELKPLANLDTALREETSALKLVLWEAGSVPISSVLPKDSPGEVRLLIGPEGGFSPEEIKGITAAGYQPVHLGPRILRTETAGLAATPILQYLYGDWQQSPAARTSNQHEETP